MSRIHFITIKADRLAAAVVITIALLGLLGYVTFLGLGMREATPVPRALLLQSIPTSTSPTPPIPTAAVGAPAPEFTLSTADGSSIGLTAYKGRPVLLYFWASWCSFCRDDMPGLQQLQDAKKDTGLAVLTINLLEKESPVKSFTGQLGIRLPLLLDSDGAVSAAYLVRATPTYVFIDKNGVLKATVVGRPRPAVFERNLGLITDEPQTPPNGSGSSTGKQPSTPSGTTSAPAPSPSQLPSTSSSSSSQPVAPTLPNTNSATSPMPAPNVTPPNTITPTPTDKAKQPTTTSL